MEFSPIVAGVNRGADQSRSASSSFVNKTLPPPCIAALSSLAPSLVGGLTTASVASAVTTFTADSDASHVDTMCSCAFDAEDEFADPHTGAHHTQDSTRTSLPVAAQAIVTAQLRTQQPHATARVIQLPGPFAEHADDTLTLSPLACGSSHLCCGPPLLVPSDDAQRAMSAANFLEDDISPRKTDLPGEVLPALSPEETALLGSGARCIRVPSTFAYPPSMAETTEAGAAVPFSLTTAVAVCSPTCSTTLPFSPAAHRSRSFDAPLPNCSAYERRSSCSEYLAAHPDGAPKLPQRRQSTFDPSESNVTLSALTTPLASTPAHVASASTRISEESVDGLPSPCRRSSPRSPSDHGIPVITATAATTAGKQQTGDTLPRVISLDAVTTPSRTRSRPALTPATTGLQGAATSTTGSTGASTTMTSVTYTRKNVSLGALDFYGNPVTSLSTLLAQISVRSGDRDELELRHQAQQQQQQQQQQKTTLSMQNLKAHTQQVGVISPEDKIKRLRVRSDTAAPITSLLRRRRVSCPVSRITAGGASPTHPIVTGSSSGNASNPGSRSQVGCLKEVLQECNFLCINDVINAIAETQAHELREAQQQLEGADCTNAAGTTSVVEASTNAAATDGGLTLGTVTMPAAAPRPPSLRRTASPPPSAWSEDGSSPLTRGTTAVSFSGGATNALLPGADGIDPQHALCLAAAITEVSLNLERSSEVSSCASNVAATMLSVQRPHFLRAVSGRAAACCMGEGTTPSVTSGSLPYVTSDAPVAVSHTSTVVTPVQLRRTDSYSSRAPSTPAEVSSPYTSAFAVFPDDPLEHKVRRNSSSEAITEASQSSTSARSEVNPTALSQTAQSIGVAPTGSSSAAKKVSGTAAAAVAAEVTTAFERERCTGRNAHHSCSPWLVLTGRYVPNWHGLSDAVEETTTQTGSVTQRQGAASMSGNAPFISPVKALPPRRDDDDCLSKGIIGYLEELGEGAVTVTGGSLQKPTGTSSSATEKRVMINCVACAPFADELTTVRELRKWAKCVAQQEILPPSTDTEVTT
ncbi:hypothetical protein ABB37_00028 [Leptomonas pyrrhocoris]|uniref:Uncharacterized protein n=1 Tax=Leptomonas pyrrhocoris TaxID=157538 RepID=A0A0N0VHM3_LEPPY|nr:hypothetical protein ABB37_00028 [Leptomonas pyrrhocoris]KPA85624.1 hypothetical protein ABB37_00028 [Leptomonas pyrrhocoris]|eukprot:XP_015664063.1 hypothetical protein ABB37_00028 [Leptomonas pyrrhocoris]